MRACLKEDVLAKKVLWPSLGRREVQLPSRIAVEISRETRASASHQSWAAQTAREARHISHVLSNHAVANTCTPFPCSSKVRSIAASLALMSSWSSSLNRNDNTKPPSGDVAWWA